MEHGRNISRETEKYQGIFPAFYACYDESGEVSGERVEQFAAYLLEKGVKGLYVGGSSGECIYHSVEERKATLEHVMKAVGGKMTVIAHVACNNTRDSRILAAHAESLGVDAIAAIPPIYFHLPEHAIAAYWNDISKAAPHTDFMIYNIPQLAGVALTVPLFREMRKNPRVKAVKNSSVPVTDIQLFKMEGGEDFVVFNGPDEQLIAGLAMGADGGIGGTYGVMPELYIKLMELCRTGETECAMALQNDLDRIIYALCAGHGNLYAMIKAVLKLRTGIDIGGVRRPLPDVVLEDMPQIEKCAAMIDEAVEKYCQTD